MRLTEHFTVEELGLAHGTSQQIQNARFLCSEVMEPIRAYWDCPVNVHDGYRDTLHNKAVGGVLCSYHLYIDGKAAIDFDIEGVGIEEAFDWIRLCSFLPIDKIIMEKDSKETPVVLHIQVDLFNKQRQRAYVGYTGATGVREFTSVDFKTKPIE